MEEFYINEMLKAFIIIDELTDTFNSLDISSNGASAIWCAMRDDLELYLGEDFYSNLNSILKERGINE